LASWVPIRTSAAFAASAEDVAFLTNFRAARAKAAASLLASIARAGGSCRFAEPSSDCPIA
jgi:hypothetical protein